MSSLPPVVIYPFPSGHYSVVVIEGVTRKARVFVGDSIVRETDKALNMGNGVVVCFMGARMEHVT